MHAGNHNTPKLEKMGTISVSLRGNADDIDRALQQKADASGAHYYVIVLKLRDCAEIT
ncbi:YdgH/BhsA/McbA-like domain containing protein [Pectobacterium sp. B2J-2]|uniref:YdgH/BhsA/McbA-like domain containing protein n=1 Tax=Pectobacterium sp. B2J-2 TaxID=3385372 RepID=UPI0038FBE7CF